MTSLFPLTGLAQDSGIPSLANAATTATTPTPSSTTSSNPLSGIVSQLGKAAATATGNSFLNAVFGNNFQYLTGIIGLLLIVAGIFLFRPVRDTVVNVSKAAGKAAAEGAVAA